MIAVVSLIVVVMVSILITRIATIMLAHTGLSKEAARFQARSAFTGAGFTTAESEKVVNHPVRRRIVMLLMLLGNAGIVTAISSLILTFVHQGQEASLVLKIVLLVTGLIGLWAIATSRCVDRHLSRLIDRALSRYTRLDIKDYASLMHLVGDYRLAELHVESQDWLANKRLAESKLRDEGVVVLGIKRPDETYLGAPKGTSEILPGDTLIIYGRVEAIEELDKRRRNWQGDQEHKEAVAAQKQVVKEEELEDTTTRTRNANIP